MTGRGIDQILPHPSLPFIPESYLRDARGYVRLAEKLHGEIPRSVSFEYLWGDAIALLQQVSPDVRLINLETSITRSDRYWPGKGINYRMHPDNIPCLTAAHIDCCVLANNHSLDWGYAGLADTLTHLHQAGIKTAGVGPNQLAAAAPAIFPLPPQGRVLIFALGSETSGIPPSWAALGDKPGVNFLPDLSERTVERIKAQVQAIKQPQDIAIASLHWGSNWGYAVLPEHRRFAHHLIDRASIDLIHGHSSHHVKGLEVYQGKLILYGCGDLINDYEGIQGYESFRDDLSLMYFVRLDPQTGTLDSLHMAPMQMRQFQLHRASPEDATWLRNTLNRESQIPGFSLMLEAGTLVLRPS